jgi:tetratricopeptide (TPR) repeat protein
VRRREESLIEEQVELVRSEGRSRLVLLYGPPGVGKTRLVRALAHRHKGADSQTAWLPPIDVDDSRYWLVSNVERFVSRQLDPKRERFGAYFEAESNAQRFAGPHVGTETVLSHLSRMRREFVRCYRSFVEQTGTVVVATLDTVETIRRMDLLLTVIRSMTVLPKTLFVLAGRPPSATDPVDPLRNLLAQPTDNLQPITVNMDGFTDQEAAAFLETTEVRNALNQQERAQLVWLTGGLPLWLELAVEYLTTVDRPSSLTEYELAELERLLPRAEDPTPEGARLREEFKRTLVSRYHNLDYWSEAIRRLAVLRYSIDPRVWAQLTADLTPPAGITTPDEAWEALLEQPWVRPRANRHLVTLHDALAEELAQRVIPLFDQDGSWRRSLWADAAVSYADLAGEPAELRHELEELTDILRAPVEPGKDVNELVKRVRQLSTQKRAFDQCNTAWLHYGLLADSDTGADLFLRLYAQAAERHDLLFQELICHEIERFLPHERTDQVAPDVLSMAVADFHRWLTSDGRSKHVRIILDVARFLTDNEQPEWAMALLATLPERLDDPSIRYRKYNELGNARMRIHGQAADAEEYFQAALHSARELPPKARERNVAQAHKELGYYYRNLGRWNDADTQYQHARTALADILGPGSDIQDRAEMASIQTNWAYLKALRGNHQDARNLVDSAIAIRRRIGNLKGIGMSLSVSGEAYRYERKFIHAWTAYAEAEATFEALRNWPWLGLLYQQQAICLHQASLDGQWLLDSPADQRSRAEQLILRAIEICRDQGVRSYPSALNRAGRIFGDEDPGKGLKYLDQAITEAGRIADGWFLSASLIEYIELNYRAWLDGHEERYRDAIFQRTKEIEEAINDYHFNDLPGRWQLLQGHLTVEDALRSQSFDGLAPALSNYQNGFAMLSSGHVGSHGFSAIGGEFETFRRLYDSLPDDVRADWYSKLLASWTQLPSAQSTSLLALLEKLY